MEYSISPEEHELRQARQIVEKTLESCSYVLEKEEELKVNLGHAEKEEARDYGVFGTARTSDSARIYFNPDTDGWKDNLEDLVADVFGQAWFYENSDTELKWQQLLASITGLMVIEKISEPREVERTGLKEEWAEKKTGLSERVSIENQEDLSWQLKTLIGRKLLEEYKLEDLPGLNRSDVLDAGDSVFAD